MTSGYKSSESALDIFLFSHGGFLFDFRLNVGSLLSLFFLKPLFFFFPLTLTSLQILLFLSLVFLLFPLSSFLFLLFLLHLLELLEEASVIVEL